MDDRFWWVKQKLSDAGEVKPLFSHAVNMFCFTENVIRLCLEVL